MSDLLFVTITPKPGQAEPAEAILRDMVGKTRAEPGNLQYDLYRYEADGRVFFHLLERYDGEAALQAHRDSAHFKAYRERILPLLEETPVLRRLTALDAVVRD